RLFGGADLPRARDEDEIDGDRDQLGGQLGQTLELSVRAAELDEEILAHNIAVLAEAVDERALRRIGVRVESGTGVEDADAVHLPRWLLCLGGERGGEERQYQNEHRGKQRSSHSERG